MMAAFKSPMRGNAKTSDSDSGADQDSLLKKEVETLTKHECFLDEQIKQLTAEGCTEDELYRHIEKLHQYNEMKDTGQSLLGHIAQKEGVTTKDLYKQFGLDLDD